MVSWRAYSEGAPVVDMCLLWLVVQVLVAGWHVREWWGEWRRGRVVRARLVERRRRLAGVARARAVREAELHRELAAYVRDTRDRDVRPIG